MRFQSTDPKKAKIIALLLEGCDDKEAAQAIRCSMGYVRTLRKILKTSGELAGKNVG